MSDAARDPGTGPADERHAVEAANARLYLAFEQGDAPAMAALWVDGEAAESAVCVHPGWPALLGRPAVLRSWSLIMANTAYVQVFLTDVRTTVHGDIAVVTCTEDVLTGLDAGDGLSGGRVVATNVFRRGADGWRVWVHHASPLLAPRADGADGRDDGADEGDDDAGEEVGR